MNNIQRTLTTSVMAAGIAAFGITIACAQSTEYIIFEVKGSAEGLAEKFVLGTVLKDGDKIELPENSEVRLLDKTGEVVILNGPLIGTITDEDGGSKKARDGSSALQVIAKLMFGENNLVNNLGAARALKSVRTDAGNIQPWIPVISKPGTYCLPMDAPVFGRFDAGKNVKVTIISGSEIFKEKVWNEKETSISVSDLVARDTDRYTLFLSSQTKESTLHLLDRTDKNTTEQIAWMAERGCKAQAVKLLKQASETAG
jgi:hypothetical protein